MVQRSALCRFRRELSNEYLLAKFGFDTAENEPSGSLLLVLSSIIIITDPPGAGRRRGGLRAAPAHRHARAAGADAAGRGERGAR